LELIVKAGVSKVEEVPIHFQDRLHGESKLSLKEQLNYVRHLGRLYRHRFPGLVRFALFGAVGSTGVVVDLSVLAVGLSCGLSSSVAAVLAIWLAMSWNFVLNRQWTFAGIEAKPDSNISDENYSFDENSSEASQPEWVLPQYINFCLGCLTGAVVNWTVRVGLLASALAFTDRPYLASIAGILSGLAFNYTICSRLVFAIATLLLATIVTSLLIRPLLTMTSQRSLARRKLNPWSQLNLVIQIVDTLTEKVSR
jgi:dolichol-phosphate mannosyltransferase